MKFGPIVPAALASLLLLSSGAAFAQVNTASQSTAGAATIIQPISLTVTSSLSFGTVVRPSSGSGTVVIGNTGDVSTTGGAVVLASSTTSYPSYSVGGEGGQAITVTFPSTMTLTGPGGATLTVTLTHTAFAANLSGALGSAGTATFTSGGTLPVTSTTTTGAYTGNYTVTVAYN